MFSTFAFKVTSVLFHIKVIAWTQSLACGYLKYFPLKVYLLKYGPNSFIHFSTIPDIIGPD